MAGAKGKSVFGGHDLAIGEIDGDSQIASDNIQKDGKNLGKRRVRVTASLLESKLAAWNQALTQQQYVMRNRVIGLQNRSGVSIYIALFLALIVGFGMFIAAAAVDFIILSELWTSFFENEFGEVPPQYANTVMAKSLQVLVAALAFHFFFRSLGAGGQKMFVIVTFLLTLALLVGLGLLYATQSMPEGTEIGGVVLNPSSAVEDTTLEDLGLAPAPGEETAEGAGTAEAAPEAAVAPGWLQAAQALSYMLLALIFIVVTSVAVLSLHIAIRAVNGLFGRIDDEGHTSQSLSHRDVKAQLAMAEEAVENLQDGAYRKTMLSGFLAQLQSGYVDGVMSRGGLLGRGGDDADGLIESFDEAKREALQRWNAERIQETIPNMPNVESLEARRARQDREAA